MKIKSLKIYLIDFLFTSQLKHYCYFIVQFEDTKGVIIEKGDGLIVLLIKLTFFMYFAFVFFQLIIVSTILIIF